MFFHKISSIGFQGKFDKFSYVFFLCVAYLVQPLCTCKFLDLFTLFFKGHLKISIFSLLMLEEFFLFYDSSVRFLYSSQGYPVSLTLGLQKKPERGLCSFFLTAFLQCFLILVLPVAGSWLTTNKIKFQVTFILLLWSLPLEGTKWFQ